MGKNIKIKAVKRRDIDEDKLALAFLLLAKILDEENKADDPEGAEESESDAEAA